MATEIEQLRFERLFERISSLIDQARTTVSRNVNTVEVYTKYEIGRYIVEDEFEGKYRAAYGKTILQNLSTRMIDRFGEGWSYETLNLCKRFYAVYSDSVTDGYKIQESNSVTTGYKINVLTQTDVSDVPKRTNPHFVLTWSHYIILLRVKNPQARNFYEIEAAKQQWSKRQLQRQVASSLYERLALSRDKDEVMRLANEGQTIEKPADLLKNPLTLEFLGLKPDASYSESKLENAIIDKLQMFLLELGKGFLFEGRQKRFTFEEDNFYVDLVFYNRLLQCYVLIDLKTDKLTHQDLGQMQMYVNYFDRYVKTDFEKSTIGILLCETKNDALVELTLPKDANIYAQQYALCLPDKALLQKKLAEWIAEYKEYEIESR
jgi:predicted nuclease of restriction endonuclease-like (RecB) superfamily